MKSFKELLVEVTKPMSAAERTKIIKYFVEFVPLDIIVSNARDWKARKPKASEVVAYESADFKTRVKMMGVFLKNMKITGKEIGFLNTKLEKIYTTKIQSNSIKAKPKKTSKSTNKISSVSTTASVRDVAMEMMLSLKSSSRSSQTDPINVTGNKATGGIRDWGYWESDEFGDEDEDDDYQTLSAESKRDLEKVISLFQKRNKGLSISYNTGEKNWIYISVKGN